MTEPRRSASLAEELAALYEMHATEARRLAYLLVGDWGLAEDLTQEAFVRIMSRQVRVQDRTRLRAYILSTVANLSKNRIRSLTRERMLRQRLEQVRSRHEEPLTSSGIEAGALQALLSTLPVRQRTAIALRYCLEFSERETADVLNTSVSAVKSLTSRGLNTLRAKYKEVEDG